MRGGDLNRRLAIQSKSPAKDSVGQRVNSWTTVVTVWAAIEPLKTRERDAAQSFHPDVTHRIRIRYRAAFADPKTMAQYRGLYGTRVFNFLGSMTVNEDNTEIHIAASEGINQG